MDRRGEVVRQSNNTFARIGEKPLPYGRGSEKVG